MVKVVIQDTFLDNRLEKALSKITNMNYGENAPVFLEVCNCPSKGGQLFYDATEKGYFGKGFCNKALLCFRIQKDKHNVMINKKPYIIPSDKKTELETERRSEHKDFVTSTTEIKSDDFKLDTYQIQ